MPQRQWPAVVWTPMQVHRHQGQT
uniref:Uncharacterized protein n=1 Tax=Arundo donax TaxID=35708 RepID=A0A0A9FD05_ARUDO